MDKNAKVFMNTNSIEEYYEKSSERFWDPGKGMTGRDLVIYPLLKGLSGTVLDHGCGSGSLLLGLAIEDRFTECIGVDISERVLSLIWQAWGDFKNPNKNKLKLIKPLNDRLPDIPDKTIDILVSAATIEHVVNPYCVLDELHRIASDNAVLICAVPNYAYLKHILQLLFGIQPRTGTDEPVENWRNVGWDGMHIHTFTKSSLSILLKDCGWEPVKWTGWGSKLSSIGFTKLRECFPGLLSGELVAVCKKVVRLYSIL